MTDHNDQTLPDSMSSATTVLTLPLSAPRSVPEAAPSHLFMAPTKTSSQTSDIIWQFTRHGKNRIEVCASTFAGVRHPHEDGVSVITLENGDLYIVIVDGITNSRGLTGGQCRTKILADATRTICSLVSPKPADVLRIVHVELVNWMARVSPQAQAGAAVAIICIKPNGGLQHVSVGDIGLYLYEPERWWRKPRVRRLNLPAVTSGNRLQSAVGQSGALAIEVGNAQISSDALFIAGSDGGLTMPVETVTSSITAWRNNRALCSQPDLLKRLDALAFEHEKFSDDRTLALVSRQLLK